MNGQQPALSSARLALRGLEEIDLNEKYLGWLNDPEVNQYLETRFLPQTRESLRSYWQTVSKDKNSPWFAICLRERMEHIGNIKIGPINWIHRNADISLFIGEKKCWGCGLASEAIAIVRDWSFSTLSLEKLSAGMYADNIGSLKAFKKCGFQLEGILRSEVTIRGGRADVLRIGLTRSEWERSSSSQPVPLATSISSETG